MIAKKTIVCLANSRKMAGRFVAGKEWSDRTRPGPWIRPVSDRPGQEVSEYERQYEDGRDPQVLDIVEIPFLRPRPDKWQSENWLIDSQSYWTKVGRYSSLDLSIFVDADAPLWVDGISTYSGQNDKVPVDLARSLKDSLRLIHVEQLKISVFSPGEAFGNSKRRVQGRFSWSDQEYALWVTDPRVEREYLAKLNGRYEIGESYLAISLGEAYRGSCYKLIATVVRRDR